MKEAERELEGLEKLPAQENKYTNLAIWVGLAVAFGAGIWYFEGGVKAQEFFAGYLLGEWTPSDQS
jgi:hypothetical protein